jgi:hypothetical protein
MKSHTWPHGITPDVQQLILSRVHDIGAASSKLFRLEELAKNICEEITDLSTLGFHFASVQIVDSITQTIKTVYGSRMPGEWYKMGSHSLEGGKKFLDIQAYIGASYTPPIIEIITGWDERFDKFIYDKFGHKTFHAHLSP